MKNSINLFDQLNWENADNYPEGTLKKTLRDGIGARTILLKIPAGFRMEPHSHITTEQILLLKGAFTSDGRTYQEGSYLLFNAHEEHGPFYSEEGALLMVIWDPYKTSE
ncbi:MAG: cupin domain-containing protein [Bacteroidota bacterium]